jgi:DNA-binding NtrC family response regulator
MRDVLGRMCKSNARKLRSYLEQPVVLSDEGVLDLPPHFASNSGMDVDADEFVPLQAMIEATERVYIRRTLGRTRGSVSKTAELLGSAARRCGKR